MPTKTFRGELETGTLNTIRITHRDGKTGYKIRTFEVMPTTGENALVEGIIQIFTIKQPASPTTINFGNPTLIAAATYGDDSNNSYRFAKSIIFDQVTFNQDIYIYYYNSAGGSIVMNYFVELEQIRLDDEEATAVILKNFRNSNTVA
jgi:hypothetical protein